ncbi:MAG: hypothetical protein ABIX46_01920 [Burkholderiaceae bacterium]
MLQDVRTLNMGPKVRALLTRWLSLQVSLSPVLWHELLKNLRLPFSQTASVRLVRVNRAEPLARTPMQELLAHSDVRTAMVHAHGLNRGGHGVLGPLDHL